MNTITSNMKLKNVDFITALMAITIFLLAGFYPIAAQCPTPPGNPAVYGNDSWIGYVYSGLDANNPPQNAFTTTVYRGYLTQPAQFDQNLGNGAPTATTICGTYTDAFSMRFRMKKTFPAGYYTFTIGGDDGERLSFDAGTSWAMQDWNYHVYQTATQTFYLDGEYYLVLENYDQGGQSRLSFAYSYCGDYSTAPTAITGTTTVCNNTATTLTATGGYATANATYQWGTGTTVGANLIGGNTASITVNPGTNSTTYWVRRVDPAPCSLTTTGTTQLVTVVAPSTNPTSITGTNSICVGASTTLTANGGSTSANGSYQWGTGSVGNNIIAGATTASIMVSPTVNTTYWVRRLDTTPCNTQTAAVTYNVTVIQTSTAPTSINNAASVCSPVGGINLTAMGGTAVSGSTYQWGTGTVVGTNPIGGQTNNSYYVNPSIVTTYWVRRYDPTPCATYTAGTTVTVYPASTAPTAITGTNLICAGSSTTLTASGGTLSVNGSYQWGTGATGSNIIAGAAGPTITVSPATTVTYWVRRIDSSPCTTVTAQTNFTVTVNQKSIGPTVIAGPATLCYPAGGGILTATGGTPGTNAVYQWGIGAVGSNILANTTSILYINPSATTTYWVRLIDAAPCSSPSSAVTFTVSVATLSTAPASISGVTAICIGGSTILTANGGTEGAGSSYQWGTGTIGNNIIAGQTAVSITVSPTATTTYWVRRINGSPCVMVPTNGPNITVTVNNNVSTAPTSISGAGTNCPGTNNTLTASGGTSASGSVYQWGTGIVGSNIIGGQTGPSITVAPNATTTYWVRRYDAGCNLYTAAAMATVTISVPGNPNTFGAGQWNVYGYRGADITLATPIYAGYYTQATLGFDSTASWSTLASPSAASNWQGCTVPVDNFTFVAKRRNFTCGTYTLTMQNWNDAAEVYVNGTLAWSCSSYSDSNACLGTVGTFNLGSTSTIEVRTREDSGNASAVLVLTNVSVSATAPSTVSGTTSICSGSSTTLTASGGTEGTNAEFQWGTGTIGSNIILGETTASITVNPTVTTTYWVRRINSLCGQTTPSVTIVVTVNPATVAGTLDTSAKTICSGTAPNAIVLTGYTGNIIKWQYANDAAFTNGVTDIASTAATLTAGEMGPITTTRYYRAVVQSCDVQYPTPVQITVPSAVTYSNGAWNGTPTATTPIVIENDLTLNTDLHVCSCLVKNGNTLTVNPNTNLIIETSLVVEPSANLIIEDKGSLVQVNDTSTDSGIIKVKKKTSRMKLYDYCYWSSPVLNNTLFQLSPATLNDKYYRFDSSINNWVSIAGGTQAMAPGKGYIVRAPQGWSANNISNGVYSAEFNGVPNNGVVPASIEKATGTFNLIGNPYPSAIDIDLFLTDPANTNIISGTIYLWTHNTAISSTTPGNAVYNYTADDYAKYNLTGGVQSANAAITGGMAPDGKVASGQGFFIEANTALANGTYTANFKNSMRVISHNNSFYKNSNTAAPNNRNPIEKNRIWLNISNVNGAYNQILVGYVTGATNGFDNLYDGKIFPAGNVLAMYTVSGTDNYAIQGRALPFDNSDVIPVGYKTTIAGDFTIALENFDGLFENQNVYVVDHLTHTTQNLKMASYHFTSAIGTFNTRFEIVFLPASTLETKYVAFDENSVSIFTKDQQVGVNASMTIKKVEIYDLIGRKVYTADGLNVNTFKTPELLSAQQVLIVKVILEGPYNITKKVVLD